MEDIANVDVPEIEITPEMIEAGALAFSAYDSRFEPIEVAALRVFQSMVEASRVARRVELASEVGVHLSPYLKPKEENSLR